MNTKRNILACRSSNASADCASVVCGSAWTSSSSTAAALARYTLDTLPNKVMVREYQLALPELKRLEAELTATRRRLERAGRKG